jgi:chromosome segregation ATPase
LEAERRIAQEARDSGTAAEKRASSLLIEIEDLRLKYDSADKARKHLESELHDSSSRLTEINITITTLTADKRRLESDLATSARDREEAAAARRSAE